MSSTTENNTAPAEAAPAVAEPVVAEAAVEEVAAEKKVSRRRRQRYVLCYEDVLPGNIVIGLEEFIIFPQIYLPFVSSHIAVPSDTLLLCFAFLIIPLTRPCHP